MADPAKILLFLVQASLVRVAHQEDYRCPENQFLSLHKNKPRCIDCFCNDITPRCRRAVYYQSRIELQDVTRVKAVTEGEGLPPNAIYHSSKNEVILGDLKDLGSSVVYWTLPREFLGKQVLAYGGTLKYTVFYDVLRKSPPYIAADIKIQGANGLTIVYTKNEVVKRRIALTNEVQIIESNFKAENGNKTSRKDVMIILSNVQGIQIRATYAKNTKVTLLSDVSIASAIPYFTRLGPAEFIERCLCPEGYHGLSCEVCQRGYTLLVSASGRRKCTRCRCNRHSLECDPESGICKNCHDNTMGDDCGRCKPGYYGDAKRGTSEDCRRCSCPLFLDSNQFSPTCYKTEFGGVKCDACQVGYRGVDCGDCAFGFDGNPRIPGGKCIRTLQIADRMPGIIVLPRRRTDPIGYRATFKCIVSGSGNFHVTWSRKDARPLPVGRSRVIPRDNSWILIISSLRTDDQGDYVCSARNRFGIASYSVIISIYERQVSPIKVNVTPKSLRIAEGSSALFLCTANTVFITYTRSWTKDGYRLLPQNAKVFDGTLAFHNAKRSDSGVYTCSASNQLSVDSATVVLSVGALKLPHLSIWPLVQTVDVGRPVQFRCTSAGFPRPEIFWSREDGDDEEGTYSMSANGFLTISNVRVVDEGGYICTARNRGGEVSRKAVLYVRSPNKRLSISVFPKNLHASAGEKVVFRCASSGQNDPTVQWNVKRKHGVDVEEGLLTFDSVLPENSGLYVCTASNQYGTVSTKVKLKVVDRPKHTLKVDMQPETLVIDEGKSATLRCNVTGTVSMITWSKDDGILSDNHKVEKYQLTITRATAKDKGTYFCIAKNKDSVARASSNLLIARKVLPKIQIGPRRKVSASIGDSVHFCCRVTEGQPVEEMAWVKDNKVLSASGNLQVNSTCDGLELRLENVQKRDEGGYFCAAVNKAGFSRKIAFLNVSGKTSLVLSPRGFHNATIGDALIFECQASGFPIPRVQWAYPSTDLRNKVKLTSWPGYARIEMEALPAVEGEYVCKASNVDGEAMDAILLKVHSDTSKPIVQVHPKTVNSVLGEPITSYCDPLGIPTPEFAWVKLRKNARSTLLSKRRELVLEDLQISDEGRYACRAWNKYGTAEANFEVKVSVPPSVSVFPTSLVLLNGRSFSLKCESSGYPTPRINWLAPRDATNVIVKDGTLEVHSSRGLHSGKYKCLSDNIGGTAEKVVNVTVLVEPKIVSSSKDDNIAKLGQNVLLYCNVSGFPEPSLSWYKDPAELLNENGWELSLRNLTTESQGQYRCIASNLAGQAACEFSLAIEEIPTANILEGSYSSLKTVPVGDPVTLTCITTGNPEPVVRWTKTDGRLPEGVLVEGGILKIANTIVTDSGTFRCSAQNPIGFVHADIQIFVQGAPVVQVDPNAIEVQIGKEARISCSATGMPAPTIQWKKVGGKLPVHFIENDQLVIPVVTRDDKGEYVCIATNSKGTAEDHVRLRTNDFLPRFSEDGESYLIYGKILGALYQTKIEITFRHENADGLLLYNGIQGGDFISIGILQGYVVFQYHLGSGPAFIRSHNKIALFEWHTLIAYRDGLDGTLTIGDDPVVHGKSKGKYTGLNLNGNLFIGGHASMDAITRQTSHKRGFTGCISQIVIGEGKFDIGKNALMMVGTSDCNICLTQPCNGKGVCLSAVNRYGYKCNCDPGYTGRSCQERVVRCFPGACGNGVCYDAGHAEFNCKCPIGSYGARCELGNSIQIPYFSNNSYMVFEGIKGAWQDLHIFIKFKPKSSNGLILFNGGCGSSVVNYDYVLVQLINGYVQMQFDAGSGPAFITHSDKVLPNAWNSVELERFRQYGSISLNGNAAAKGASQGDAIALNLGPFLFIGGINSSVEKSFNQSFAVKDSFNGCIQDLIVNRERLDLVKDFLSNKDVMDCSGKVSPCFPSPCLNNGKCQIVSAVTYKCICPLRYFGSTCEIFKSGCGDIESCLNGGTCLKNREYELICYCKLGYTGRACEKAIQIGKEALLKGRGYLQFPRHLLSKTELSYLKFDMKTKADNGLIFWFGEEKESPNRENPDFLSIGLKNGFIEISYELGSGLAVILTGSPVNDGNWHTIQIKRSAKNASLYIDNKLAGETHSSGINTHLDIEAPMFFGGGNNVELLTRQKFKRSYFGCIGNVLIENREVFLQDMAEDGRNIHPCFEDSI